MRVLFSFVVLLSACGDEAPQWVGSYDTTSTWNVSGPLAGGRTVGDAIADLLVDGIVGASGVPSLLEDQAHEALSDLIREDVKGAVDGYVPAELAPTGTMTQLLGEALASLTVESTLTLEEGFLPGSLEGNETITNLSYAHGGVLHDILPADLLGALGATMKAEWKGDEEDDATLEIEPHGVSLHYGELVRLVALNVVDEAGLSELQDDVATAVNCSTIVAAILGDDASLELSISDWTYEMNAADIGSACDSTHSAVEDQVLGVFVKDAGVTVGGILSFTANSLTSEDGFGGVINIAPEAIAPKIAVTLEATRR